MTESPSPSLDPQVQAAIEAYEKFADTTAQATRDPGAFLDGADPGNDFATYSFDPARGEYIAYVMGLDQQGAAFRGTPPLPRVRVQSAGLDAKPWPRVLLSDCRTPAPTWEKYVVKTGARVPSANGPVPPPYRLTVTMIYYDGRWGIQDSKSDKSQTCTAP